MERLPFELMDNIFDLVSIPDVCSLCLLNHDWNRIASERLYRAPKIHNKKQLELFTTIHEKLQRHIQVLDLVPVHQYLTKDHLSQLEHVNNLRYLNLSKGAHISPDTILTLIKNNVFQLNTLLLANCTLTMDILRVIGEANHHQLKYLDLSNTMIKPCISIDSFHHLETMITSPMSSSQLIDLNLSYCAWVNSQTIENVASGLPQLQHITLRWCNQVKVDSIQALVRRLSKLHTIDLREIDSIETAEQLGFIILDHASSLKRILFTCKRTTIQVEL